MKQIWKFPIKNIAELEIEMPKGATILTVQTQSESVCLWALVDTKAPTETRQFAVYGTGEDIDDESAAHSYIGTFQIAKGAIVFHLFELI